MIDGHNLALERGTGVATYTRNLTQAIAQLGHEPAVLYGNRAVYGPNALLREVSLFDVVAPPPRPPRWKRIAREWKEQVTSALGVTAQHVPVTGAVITRHFEQRLPASSQFYNHPNIFNFSRQFFTRQNRFLRVRFDQAPAIFHSTYPLPIKVAKAVNIYTLHDLVPLRLPFTTLDNKRYYYSLVKRIADQADHIVTVSEHSRQDIISLLNVPPERVTNTYQTVALARKYIDRTEAEVANEVAGNLGVDYKKYFLFFGAMDPKKNIARIIEAYQGADVMMPLLMEGGQAWREEHARRMSPKGANNQARLDIGPLPKSPNIHMLDYLPFDMLMTAMRGARAVIFPSLYEGFGLPILEAMQLGTPVISSTASSIPEVAGEAALLVDPYDTDAIRRAIETLAADDDLCAELSRRGPLQTEQFSMDKYCARLAGVYSKFV